VIPWLFFASALLLLALSGRMRGRLWRRGGQGASVLLALAATLILARRSGTTLPGSRPRPWYSP
jgi:hypothetical protein